LQLAIEKKRKNKKKKKSKKKNDNGQNAFKGATNITLY
jgi:hypothetical protein